MGRHAFQRCSQKEAGRGQKSWRRVRGGYEAPVGACGSSAPAMAATWSSPSVLQNINSTVHMGLEIESGFSLVLQGWGSCGSARLHRAPGQP